MMTHYVSLHHPLRESNQQQPVHISDILSGKYYRKDILNFTILQAEQYLFVYNSNFTLRAAVNAQLLIEATGRVANDISNL